ncbi:hypothetical protein LCGC14_1125320 [marine sediment metagenome]|uniref:Uncharacterized protein n=1 Tax=marine sediment metagenome TaxID=412755 RepID=A0A0F9MQM6_9ZZZZ
MAKQDSIAVGKKTFQEEFKITDEEKEVLIVRLADEFGKIACASAKEETRAILENMWDVHYLSTRTVVFECMIEKTNLSILKTLYKMRTL